MPDFLSLRTDAQSTTSFVATAIAYAKLPAVREIRLCISKKYVEGATLPSQDHTLTHNSPLLFILAEMALPGVSKKLYVVHDYPGLTIQREPREVEVRALISKLLEIAPGKVVYGTQPVDATSHMPVETAAGVLMSSDYVELTAVTMNDLFRRMKGY
jgi:hypothetical protein